jgi:hypothetical protein
VSGFDATEYARLLTAKAGFESDYQAFRDGLFGAADLPDEPDETWSAFVGSGDIYRKHLEEKGLHDEGRCLYCRQHLSQAAAQLLAKYREYLENKIAGEITKTGSALSALIQGVKGLQLAEVRSYLDENANGDDPTAEVVLLRNVSGLVSEAMSAVSSLEAFRTAVVSEASSSLTNLDGRRRDASHALEGLREQASNRTETLAKERKKLIELTAAVELGRSWPQVQAQVADAKEADRLAILSRAFAGLGRQVTDLAKQSSDVMINRSFDALFAEECEALRAPSLKVQFVGRQGKAHRRKVLKGQHKPSKVLSEGEQKVLAIADFLAEARLSGITATVVFDDPVTSLDHRRIDEVAERVARLAETAQVIVFTHDILFATKLLSLFETSQRCIYYQVTDDDAKGEVTRATGPRWDTLSYFRARINEAIQDAKASHGETRAAFVRTGYDWLRSWIEVFTETDLLEGVTQRYQPNVRMMNLTRIKVGALPVAIATATEVFDRACRYIDGHSQPLPSLSVSPTLAALEADWKTLQDCRATYNAASN